MQYRQLGRSSLKSSAIGLGCMGMSHAYGAPADRLDMERLISFAVDCGVTMFDTAEVYGTDEDPHDNENLLGAALASFRDKVLIATKFGLSFDRSSGTAPWPLVPDSRPETIRTAVEGSLKRLRTDHIDLYYQHRPDPSVEPEAVAQVMSDLIREGKILHWGVSEATETYIRRAHAVTPMAAVQHRYSMMARWNESLFPALEELGIGLVAFSPLANGLLTNNYSAESTFDPKTDYRAHMPQFQSDAFEKNRDLLDLLTDLADSHHATPAQVSLAWMLCKKSWIVPIPGTRKYYRLKENIGAADIHLTPSEVADIDNALDNMEMTEVFGGSKITK